MTTPAQIIDWISHQRGVCIDRTGHYGAQAPDLVNDYAAELYGLPYIFGHGHDVAGNLARSHGWKEIAPDQPVLLAHFVAFRRPAIEALVPLARARGEHARCGRPLLPRARALLPRARRRRARRDGGLPDRVAVDLGRLVVGDVAGPVLLGLIAAGVFFVCLFGGGLIADPSRLIAAGWQPSVETKAGLAAMAHVS